MKLINRKSLKLIEIWQDTRNEYFLQLEELLNNISDRDCELCQSRRAVENKFLCEICSKKIPILSLEVSIKEIENSKILFSTIYQEKAKELILKCKYQDLHLTSFWAYILAEYWQENHTKITELYKLEEAESFFVIAIPLHSSRKRKRTYNQSELIARSFSKLMNKFSKAKFIHYDKFLLRSKISPSLFKESKDSRTKLLKGIFELNPKYKKLRVGNIILIDDITTTGQTILEAKNCLEQVFSEISVIPLICSGRNA